MHETLGSNTSKKKGKEGGVGREEEAGKEKRERKCNRDRRREGIGRENREEMLSHKPGMVAYTRNP